MTETSLAPISGLTAFSSSRVSKKDSHKNSSAATENHFAASSSSAKIYRTGSAGVPSPPDSPLASSTSAATGISPSPLEFASKMSSPVIKVQDIEDEDSSLDSSDSESNADVLAEESYDLWNSKPTSPPPHRPPPHRPPPRPPAAGAIRRDEYSAAKNPVDIKRPGNKYSSAVVKKEWMEVQVTTFTNWINDRLKAGKHDRKVEDLSADLQDGMLLIKLLENLTKKKVKGYTGTIPKTEAHKRVNLDLAFQFMQSEKIKMIGVGGMNIYQRNITLILGMIWMLIQKYQIRMQGYKVSTKSVMIQWLQALLPKWNITNLTSDWKDGRALIVVIDSVKPGIAPNVATLDPTKQRQNCILAIKIANSYLKIPKIISPDDLSSGEVDDLSMMTYLSYFVDPFRAKLLKWAQKCIPQFNISGFSGDWYNGKAFGAMMEKCFPDASIDWENLEAANTKEYVDELLKTAKKKLGISAPFASADLASGKVEEMQIMTMIMLIRNGNLISLPDEISVQGPGIKGANLQQETSFVIDTTSAGPGQLYIDAYYEEDGQKLKFSLTEKTKLKQAFRVTYTPSLPSSIIFDILWSDAPIPHSPFTVPVTDSTLINIVDFDSHSTLVEAGKPVTLLLNTKKAGNGTVSGYLLFNKEKILADAKSLSNGIVSLTYTPPRPGKTTLHILWNKEELHHLAVSYTVVDIGGYSVQSLPTKHIYNVFEPPEFCILSAKGLPLNVLQMTAILDEDVHIAIKFKNIDGNRGYASFVPTLPGTYRVEVVCANQLIKGTPFSVRVTDPHSCRVRGEIPSFLRIGKPHVFEIDTRETGVGSITFESSDHDISTLFKTEHLPFDSSDLQKLKVTPTTEGDYLVGIKYLNQWVSNSPFRLQICDPTKFSVTQKPSAANVSKPVELTIEAQEKCDEGALKPVIKATGPSAKYSPQVQLSDDGKKYHVQFVPWEIGNHEISITYGSFDIPESPIVLPVITFDTNACSATGIGLQKAYTNVPSQFLIFSQRSGLIEDGTVSIKVTSVLDSSVCQIRARDNSDGTYSVAYLIQQPGAYLISIEAAGQHIPGSPFKLNALPGPEPEKCIMYGPALEEGTVLTFGKPIDFTVDTSNAGMGKLSVKAIGPEGTAARVFVAKTDQPGKYDINIDALRHGKHRVSVKWADSHIPYSPFVIKVFPGADPRKCIAHGPGLEDGLVGKKSSFNIETNNAGAGVLRVRLHGVKGAFKIVIEPIDQKNRRTLLANYNPSQPGEYLITIKWSDVHIPGSPFKVKIAGEGTEKSPMIFMPTPTPPEIEDFIEEDDYGEEDDNPESVAMDVAVSAPLLSQDKRVDIPAPQTFAPKGPGLQQRVNNSTRGGKMLTFNNMQRRALKPTKRRNKGFDGKVNGQVTVRVNNKRYKKK